MCISRCYIIFWGDKTIKFGVNVIQRHSSKRQRYESSSEKTWSTLRWLQRCDELRQELKWCVSFRECCLLPWVVCVSEISSCFDDGSSTFSRRVSVELWNVLMKHSDVELWTAEMSFQCNVRLMNDIRQWTFCYWMNSFIKMVYEVRCYCFNDCWWNIFRHLSIIFLVFSLFDEHSSCLHSFW